MARREKRNSVSIKGLVYQRAKDYCDAHGFSVSGLIEILVEEKFGPLSPEDRKKFDELIAKRQAEKDCKEPEGDELKNYIRPILFL